jgi:hypothetical protein
LSVLIERSVKGARVSRALNGLGLGRSGTMTSASIHIGSYDASKHVRRLKWNCDGYVFLFILNDRLSEELLKEIHRLHEKESTISLLIEGQDTQGDYFKVQAHFIVHQMFNWAKEDFIEVVFQRWHNIEAEPNPGGRQGMLPMEVL